MRKLSKAEIFNILTKELPYDCRTTRFSIRNRVANIIFKAQERKELGV